MAFTTEFVMGAGGAEVEEIPVSASGISGSGSVYPLTTVDAGTGAWVWVDSEKTGSGAPVLNVGPKNYAMNSGTTRAGGGGYFTGNVVITATGTSFTSASIVGTVYVTRG